MDVVNVDDLIAFAQQNHAGFCGWPTEQLRLFFEKYKNLTLMQKNDSGEITAFTVYQPFSEGHAYLVCTVSDGTGKNWVRELLRQLKKITWFDEEEMEMRTLCR
jgi:hypothetical protein